MGYWDGTYSDSDYWNKDSYSEIDNNDSADDTWQTDPELEWMLFYDPE